MYQNARILPTPFSVFYLSHRRSLTALNNTAERGPKHTTAEKGALPLDICILGRTSASAASEHCPAHKATTARIVVVEEPTNQLSCGIKAADRTSCSIKHLRVCIDT